MQHANGLYSLGLPGVLPFLLRHAGNYALHLDAVDLLPCHLAADPAMPTGGRLSHLLAIGAYILWGLALLCLSTHHVTYSYALLSFLHA